MVRQEDHLLTDGQDLMLGLAESRTTKIYNEANIGTLWSSVMPYC